MRIFVLIIGVLVLSLGGGVLANTDLSKLVGKQIYRDVPAQNETEYDTAYQNISYIIDSYNENIMSLRNENGRLIVLNRDLWDDGNWKEVNIHLFDLVERLCATATATEDITEFARKNNLRKLNCVNCKKSGGLYVCGVILRCNKCNEFSLRSEYYLQIKSIDNECDCYCDVDKSNIMISLKSLIGKKIHRTKAWGIDKSYMDEPRKLIDVTCKYIILESDITNPIVKEIKLERRQWDDGNWKEWKEPRRLGVMEMIGTETMHTGYWGKTKYKCIRCGISLVINPIGYYCVKCKTGWYIKEE